MRASVWTALIMQASPSPLVSVSLSCKASHFELVFRKKKLTQKKKKKKSKADRDSAYRKLLLMPDNKAVEQIRLDLARTLTHHRMFEEKGGEGQTRLLRVLKAYSYHNPSVGYCQGMSYLAAILLTVLPEEEAFHGLCVVVGGMEGYFVPTMWELLEDGKIFKNMLAARLPDVHAHLDEHGILPLMFICKWFMTMFSQLPWPTVLRVLDLFLLEGKTALFRFGFSILDIHRRELLALSSIDVLLPFLLEPNTRKLQPHVLVPHALHPDRPVEDWVRVAVGQLRDGQELLSKIANAGTPKREAAKPAVAQMPKPAAVAAPSTSTTTSSSNSSFFDRFLSSISTPVRSQVQKRVDLSSVDQPRVVATPPRRPALNFNSPLSPSSSRLNTPPLFEGMKKRGRAVEGPENEAAIPSPSKLNRVQIN